MRTIIEIAASLARRDGLPDDASEATFNWLGKCSIELRVAYDELNAELAKLREEVRASEVLRQSKDETIRQLTEERSELRAALSKILGYDRNFYDNGRPGYESIARDALNGGSDVGSTPSLHEGERG